MVEDLTDDPIEGSNTIAEPDMETITLDGETVTVPKEYAEKLKQIETNMKSGLNRKHEAKQKDLAVRLRADKEWLNLHGDRPELWALYEPTVDGGRGFIGSTDMLNEPSGKTELKQTTAEQNSEVAELKQKVADLEARVSIVQTTTEKTSISQAARARDASLAKHQYASREILSKEMEHYYFIKGEHPSPEIIEEFAKTEHDRIAKIKGTTTVIPAIVDTTTLPKPSNVPATGVKPKLPRIDDTQGVVKLMEDMNIQFK